MYSIHGTCRAPFVEYILLYLCMSHMRHVYKKWRYSVMPKFSLEFQNVERNENTWFRSCFYTSPGPALQKKCADSYPIKIVGHLLFVNLHRDNLPWITSLSDSYIVVLDGYSIAFFERTPGFWFFVSIRISWLLSIVFNESLVCENHWPFLKPLLVGFKTFIFFVLTRITCTLSRWKNDLSAVSNVKKGLMSCSEVNNADMLLLLSRL